MEHSTAITFLKKILEQYRLNYHFLYDSVSSFEIQLTPNTIYSISDDFLSNYFMIELPNKEERCFLVIGPYTEHDFTQTELILLAKKHKIPNHIKESMLQYYMTIPFIADSSHIRIVLTSFYESIWKNHEPCMLKEVQHNLIKQYETDPPTDLLENISEATDFSFKMKLIEERYQIETSLIKYISQGNYDKSFSTLTGLNTSFMVKRCL